MAHLKAWEYTEMVNEEQAKKPTTRKASAAKSTQPASAEAKPAKASAKATASDKSKAKPVAKTEGSATTKKPATRKLAAKKESTVIAPVAPVAAPSFSATSLIFQAPDLPTPMIEPKTGRPVSAKSKNQPKGQAKGNAKSGANPQSEAEGEETHLRRRARRRDGEQVDVKDPNTVVKVRTPREAPVPSNEPQRVKGSTRLEAKKQRRRDGRDAGRRRSVITESEFLARREAVDRSMIVRSAAGKIQIGVLEDKVLVEHYVAKSQEAS
ncbi:MAG: hypothetical protein RL556_681, partial [Actinomycetota bacterium]